MKDIGQRQFLSQFVMTQDVCNVFITESMVFLIISSFFFIGIRICPSDSYSLKMIIRTDPVIT